MDFSKYVNGTAQEGFENRSYISNESEVFLFQLYDNHVYPETENIANSVFRVTPHENITIEAWNHAVKVELLNVSNSSRYGFFEIMVEKEHTWTSVGQVLYCNSSYSSGYFLADDNCVSFYSLRKDNYDHSHSSLSKHVVIPFSVNETTGIDVSAVSVGSRLFMKGIGGQYDSTSPYDSGYQLLPRYQSDITVFNPSVGNYFHLEVSGNPFAPSLGETMQIEYSGPQGTRFNLTLFDRAGRALAHPAINSPAGDIFNWDGRDDWNEFSQWASISCCLKAYPLTETD